MSAFLVLATLAGSNAGGAGTVAGAMNGAPRRILSINVCADQLVLALADRDQIAALTRNVTDPELSASAKQARGVPTVGGSAEEILALAPDLVVGMPASGSPALLALGTRRYATLDVPFANNYADILTSIRVVARAVGHPDRGEALIARMNAGLARLPRARAPVVAAYYQRRGYLTGTGTLVDDMMRRAGMVNLAARLNRPPLSILSLEEMVAARPDYLIVESPTGPAHDQGTQMLTHPALRDIPRIAIPQAWTVCGGPAYVQAVRALAMKANAPRPATGSVRSGH
nr:ABC transporter substrate-binding protein [Sphingobium sp. OAS761]